MYNDKDTDSLFHIPLEVVATNTERAEQIAPEANKNLETMATSISSSSIAATMQTAPIQTVSTSSFMPIYHSVEASEDDKKLYKELSSVSDEVLACRNAILNNVY